MKRFWGHLWAAGIVVGVGGVLLPACAHDDSSLFIRQVVAPPIFTPGLGCLYPAPSEAAVALFEGHFDVGLSSAYSPVVTIGNQLIPRGDPLNVRTETARVQINGAIVRLTDSVGTELSSFTSLTSAFLDPAQGTTAGLGQAAITLIDPPTARLLRGDPGNKDLVAQYGPSGSEFLGKRASTKQVVAYFKVYGQTLGGVYVESGESQFVITVCNGCLVEFPSDASTAVPPAINCDAPLPMGNGSGLALPCAQGQEGPIDCRLCRGLYACNPANLN